MHRARNASGMERGNSFDPGSVKIDRNTRTHDKLPLNVTALREAKIMFLKYKLSNSQPVSSATLDSTRVAQIRIPWETAEVNNSQR